MHGLVLGSSLLHTRVPQRQQSSFDTKPPEHVRPRAADLRGRVLRLRVDGGQDALPAELARGSPAAADVDEQLDERVCR